MTFGNSADGYSAVYDRSSKTDITKTYNGGSITFNDEIYVYHGTRRLWENRDYTVKYTNNMMTADASSAKAPAFTLTGKGSYSESLTFAFTITPESMDNAVLTSESAVTVAPGAKLNSIKTALTYNGKALKPGKDYTLTYEVSDDGNTYKDTAATTAAQAGKTYAVSFEGKGNFSGKSAKHKIRVVVIDNKNKSVVPMVKVKVNLPKQSWTGNEVTKSDLQKMFEDGRASVMNGKTALVYGTDYTVGKQDGSLSFTDAGKYNVLITGTAAEPADGKISYVGTKTAVYEITGVPANKVKVACFNTTPAYTGEEITLKDLYKADKTGYKQVTLYTMNGKTAVVLNEGTDYDVQMINSGSTGKINVQFKLKGRYSGIIKKTATIGAENIAYAMVTVSDASYSRAGAIPENVTVTLEGKTLREGIDYTLSYKNNAKVSSKGIKGAPYVIVKGIGNYAGSKNVEFTVVKSVITDQVTLISADKAYNAKAGKGYYKSVPKIMDDGKAITIGKDVEKFDVKKAYKYYYAQTGVEIAEDAVVPAGTQIEVRVTVSCGANSPYKEGSYELKGLYKILDTGKDIKKANVRVKDPGKLVFNNGKLITITQQDLIVSVGKQVLKSTDYEIVSITNNRFLGTAKVVIRGQGEYGGTKTFTFKINTRAI